MGAINIRVDQTINSLLHKPRIDGSPLYVRIDGEDKQSDVTDNFKAVSSTTFNSPTNIRAVWISASYVSVAYFVPYAIKSGLSSQAGTIGTPKWCDVPSEGLINSHPKYTERHENLWKYLLALMTRQEDLQLSRQMEMNKMPNFKLDTVTFHGNGFTVLKRPWVCSNIEEIYIDGSILGGYITKINDPQVVQILQQSLSGAVQIGASQIPLKVFCLSLGISNITEMRKQFPRLRTIGIISELDKMKDYTYQTFASINSVTNNKTALARWIEKPQIAEMLPKIGGIQAVSILNDVSHFNSNFAIRSGIYKFDDEILLPYMDKYKQRLQSLASGATKLVNDEAEQEENKKNTDTNEAKSELEIVLESSNNNLSKIWGGLLLIHGSDYMKAQISKMSNSGQQYFKKLFKYE